MDLGHMIELTRTHPRHLGGPPIEPEPASPEQGFGRLFFQALGQVNEMQKKGLDLTRAMITDPDSVNVHDVTIAVAEANLALSMTKTIMDRAVRAYREIINIR